jgi:protochlorophyllide reductase
MRVVMTGGTSGIGLVAAEHLLKRGVQLVIGARRALPSALAGRADRLALDLADLDSVRAFARQVMAEPFDVLLLNAGMQVARDQRSPQGFELTFATNHLAHHLLAQTLAPKLNPNGRVILTASGVHDPEAKTGMPPPNHADAHRLAFPETDPTLDADPGQAGRRAYSSSKLCNVMTARTLARRLAAERPDVAVAALDPGFTPGTGLARDYPAPISFVFRRVLPLVVRGERVSTPQRSGAFLADLAVTPEYAGARGDYFSVRGQSLKRVDPSVYARDDAAGERLWVESEALIGPE